MAPLYLPSHTYQNIFYENQKRVEGGEGGRWVINTAPRNNSLDCRSSK